MARSRKNIAPYLIRQLVVVNTVFSDIFVSDSGTASSSNVETHDPTPTTFYLCTILSTR